MLYQTPKFDHSQFVNFDKQFEGILPLWFSKWWDRFGLVPDIFPLKLVEAFRIFKANYKVDSYGAKFSPWLYFVKKYKIPWILRWQYVREDDIVDRHQFVKWWDKFPQIDVIVKTVNKEYGGKLSLPAPTSPIAAKLVTPDTFCKKKDKVTDAAASSSSSKSKKKKGLSKKKMEMMKLLLKSIDDNDNDEDSQTSSEGSVNPDLSLFGHDPDDDFPGLDDLQPQCSMLLQLFY